MPHLSRLPNAPLAEVVFELRWALRGEGEVPPPFRSDPGYGVFAELFSKAIARKGFPAKKTTISAPHEAVAYSVGLRFYEDDDRNFPLLQIGPGIFAANRSSEYEWANYKKLVLDGVETVIECYPKIPGFPFKPALLELRYIDIFDKALVGTVAFIDFLRQATNMDVMLPAFLNDKTRFDKDASGRVVFMAPVKGVKEMTFRVDIGSAQRKEETSDVSQSMVRLESKITSRGVGVPKLATRQSFLTKLNRWLEDAHSITSPFFKSLMRSKAMDKFK